MELNSYNPEDLSFLAIEVPIAKAKNSPRKVPKGESPSYKVSPSFTKTHPVAVPQREYDGPSADFESIVRECAFVRSWQEHAEGLSEPSWYAGISIAARCTDGPDIVHKFSAKDPRYDEGETNTKIQHALDDGGPFLCTTIEANNGDEYCGTCPNKGKVKSPIVLGHRRSQVDPVEELNKEFAVIRTKNGCCILHEVIDPLTGYRDFDLLNGQSFALLLSNKKVPGIGKNGMPQATPLSKIWLESPKRRELPGGVVMDPARTTDPSKCYNMYSGLSVAPKPGDWSLFKEHIRLCIAGGNQKIFEFILAWVADLVQHPGGPRPGTAIALIGKQGTGKGIFANNIGKMLGIHYVTITDQAHLTGRFNHHLACCLLCFVDEAIWANDKAAEGVLKARITEPSMLYEAKGRDPFPIANHARFIIASNNPHVVPAGCDERRFLVVTVSDEHRQDHKYFQAMQRQMEAGGYEAMLFDLLQVDVSKVNLRQAPRTATLLDQIMHSLPPVQKYWLDCLHRGGSYSSAPDNEKSFKDDLSWGFGEDGKHILPRLLYMDYLAWVNAAKVRYPGTEDAFYKDIRKICEVVKLQKTVHGVGRQWSYQIPSLAQCRAQFESHVNLKVTWFDEETDEMELPAAKPIEMPEYSIPLECFAANPSSSSIALAI